VGVLGVWGFSGWKMREGSYGGGDSPWVELGGLVCLEGWLCREGSGCGCSCVGVPLGLLRAVRGGPSGLLLGLSAGRSSSSSLPSTEGSDGAALNTAGLDLGVRGISVGILDGGGLCGPRGSGGCRALCGCPREGLTPRSGTRPAAG